MTLEMTGQVPNSAELIVKRRELLISTLPRVTRAIVVFDHDIYRVTLFGSLAKNVRKPGIQNLHDTSDIDLLVEWPDFADGFLKSRYIPLIAHLDRLGFMPVDTTVGGLVNIQPAKPTTDIDQITFSEPGNIRRCGIVLFQLVTVPVFGTFPRFYGLNTQKGYPAH